MTYSIGGTTVIEANGKIQWSKVLAPSMYFGVSNTVALTANNSTGYTDQYGYSIESANSTTIRLAYRIYNCVCACECSSCFLGSAMVRTADGTNKRIDEIKVGDKLVGAFGEINTVLGLDHVKLGHRPMFSINGDHFSTEEHSHIGVDRNFYVPSIEEAVSEYNEYFPIIVENDEVVRFRYRGLTDTSRMKKMKVGQILQTTSGPKEIKTFEKVWMPPETPLYTLVMSGSHTYTADGYAVIGWPRDDDFDYDSWTQIKELTLKDYE